VLVVAAAAAVRLLYLVFYLRSPLEGYHIVDQAYYLDWARQIAAGDWWGREAFEQGPLYPYLLGLAFRSVGERLTLVLVAQLAIGAGAVVLTAVCARRLFGHRASLVAGLIAALYGPLVFYECMIMKSFLEPAFTVLAFYAVLRFRDDLRGRWLWLAGLAIGTACLLRESHVLLAIPAACFAAFPSSPQANDFSRRKRLLSAATLIIATLLPLLPSALRNYRVAGEWVWVTAGGGEVFYMAHGPSATGYYSPPAFITARPPLEHEDFRREAQLRTGQELSRGQASRYWFREGLRHILADPLRTLRLTAIKAAVLLNDFEVPDSESYSIAAQFIPLLRVLPSFGWLAGLGVWGIVLCLRDWRRHWLPVAFVAAYALPVLLLYNFGRFRIGMLPVWIVLAAHALEWILRTWRSPAPGGPSKTVPALLVVGLVTLVSFLPPLGHQQMDYRVGSLLLEGSLARRAGDAARAEGAFKQALELSKQGFESQGSRRGSQHPAARKLAEAHMELASLYRSQDRVNDALAHYAAAVDVQPDSLEAHYNLANLLMASGQAAAAIEHYERALAINPRDVDTLTNLGAARLAEGRFEEAAARLEAALAIDPRSAKAHYNLANARLLQGQVPGAIEHYRQSIQLDPGNPDVHNNLGQAYLRGQQAPEAAAQFRQALALDGNHANARLNLARALEAQGNRPESAAEYRRALGLFSPDSPQAQAIQERLRALETR
jgi:tetratricopeptide (TPR) repeat protein